MDSTLLDLIPGHWYQHYKGNYYKVTGLATFKDANPNLDECCIVRYEDEDGTPYDRLFETFTGVTFDRDKAKNVPRFKHIGEFLPPEHFTEKIARLLRKNGGDAAVPGVELLLARAEVYPTIKVQIDTMNHTGEFDLVKVSGQFTLTEDDVAELKAMGWCTRGDPDDCLKIAYWLFPDPVAGPLQR